MAYRTGTAASPNDLLDQFRQFLVDYGWTVNKFEAVGAGYRLHVQKGADLFFNFRSFNNDARDGSQVGRIGTSEQANGICFNGSTAYDAGANWYNQTGAPMKANNYFKGASILNLVGAKTFHFFAFTDGAAEAVYMVVESAASQFEWLGFGRLRKQGTYAGGQFFFGKESFTDADNLFAGNRFPFVRNTSFGGAVGNPTYGYVYVECDGVTGWRTSNEALTNGGGERVFTDEQMNVLTSYCTPSGYSQTTAPKPIRFYITRNGATFEVGTPISPLGYLPEIYFINLRDIVAGATEEIGGVEYKVFSYNVKSDANPAFGSTGYYGFAIKAA